MAWSLFSPLPPGMRAGVGLPVNLGCGAHAAADEAQSQEAPGQSAEVDRVSCIGDSGGFQLEFARVSRPRSIRQ